MTDSNNRIGSWIREHRNRCRLSQTQLAEEVGVAQHTISDYEIGLRSPQADLLEMIVEVLGGEMILQERDGFVYEGDYK